MVLFVLSVKAELDGVSSFSIAPGANICLSIRNPLSDYEVREKIVIDSAEYIEQEGREPPVHFAIKWEGSQKRSTIEVLDGAAAKASLKKVAKKSRGGGRHESGLGVPREMTADDSGDFVPILALECRGVEPYAFHPLGNEFVVTSEGGVKFEKDVDVSEGDWAEYDEENDAAVSISEFESKFIAV